MNGLSALTRRRFLTWSGVAAGVALAGGAGAVGVSDLLARHPDTSTSPVLVLVTLYGGNDGLNTVVPAGDPAYAAGRPDLAYRPDEVLDLGDGLGLNPGMPELHALWGAGRLGIVRGVGYPKPDRSHFRSMAIWQTASPATSVPTGWLGRWLDATGDDPVRALSLEPTLPPFLAGQRLAGSTLRPDGLTVPGGALGTAFGALGASSPDDSPAEARAAGAIADVHTVAAAVGAALATPPAGTGALAAQLGAIGALIRAGVPARVYSTSLGGFDTHADERATQQRLLGELDSALGAFAGTVAGIDRPVVTVVYSEFGRRVAANAGDGTDHGTAAPVFVLGNGIRAGFQGAQPSLTDLDDGDLRYTTDFRDLYASVLQDVLQTDPGPVLGDWSGRVPLLAT